MSTQNKSAEDIPKTLVETLNQVSASLDREAEVCFEVFERRRQVNPGSAQGFQKRGMFINRQYKSTNKAAIRLMYITDIMKAAYSTKADDEGHIKLDELLIGKEQKALLSSVCEHSVIPYSIHVLSIGSLFNALMQYPM